MSADAMGAAHHEADDTAAASTTVIAEHTTWRASSCLRELCELRWTVLSVVCFLTFGSSFIFDFPGSIGTGNVHTIEAAFRQHGKVYTQSMNQLLYSVYSWPNTVLAIFGGLLIDRYLGLRRATVIFSSLVCLGALTFYLGVRMLNYPMLLLGRVLFGLGSESLGVAQSSFVARWFSTGRGMALAFCITICFARVGSSFNFLLSPAIAKVHGVATATLLGVFACLLSFVACVVLVLVDVYAVRVRYIKADAHEQQQQQQQQAAAANNDDEDNNGEALSDDADPVMSVMHFSDIKSMSAAFWLLCGMCVLCYSTIAPFFGIARNFFEVKYGYSGKLASDYISSFQLSSALASPFIGLLVDSFGRNTWWLLLASASFVVVHCLFLFTTLPAIVMLITLGVTLSFLSSGLWPAIPWVVRANMVGFSYGVMTAIQNMGLAIVPIIVGAILDNNMPPATAPSSSTSGSDSHASETAGQSSGAGAADTLPTLTGYMHVELLLICIGAAAFLISVALLFYDLRYARGVLSVSAARRKALLEEQWVLLNVEDEQQAHLSDLVI